MIRLSRQKQIMAISCAVGLTAAATSAFSQEHASPVRINPEHMAGINLPGASSEPFQPILIEGEMHIKRSILFDGAELDVRVFESTPAKTDHRDDPVTFDEFVYVLSGKLILTEPDGTVHEYLPGDAVVVPLGYRGTWEMQGNYRELVVLKK